MRGARRGWGKGASPRGAPQPRRPGGGVVPQWVKVVTDLCRPVAAWSKRRRICRTELKANPLCRHQRRLQRGAAQPGVGHSAAAGAGSLLPAPASADLRGGQYPHRVPERAAPGDASASPRLARLALGARTRTRAHIHTHTHPHTCGKQGRAARSLNISVRARSSPGRLSALPVALRASCQPPDLLDSSLLA